MSHEKMMAIFYSFAIGSLGLLILEGGLYQLYRIARGWISFTNSFDSPGTIALFQVWVGSCLLALSIVLFML